MNSRLNIAALLCLAAALFQPHPVLADQLTVYSTVAAKGALELITPEFERASGHTLQLKFGTAAELKAQIEKGAAFDVALLTSAAIDDLIKQLRIAPGSKLVVFKSGVGIAAKKGAVAPAVTSSEELKAAVLGAKAVALSTQGASGAIVRRAFETLGITEAMAPKIVLVSDMTAPEAVVRGRAELAFTQISEILDTPDAQLLGPLPADLQSLSAFAVGTSADLKATGAVSAFLKALTSPSAHSHMRARGLLPE